VDTLIPRVCEVFERKFKVNVDADKNVFIRYSFIIHKGLGSVCAVSGTSGIQELCKKEVCDCASVA